MSGSDIMLSWSRLCCATLTTRGETWTAEVGPEKGVRRRPVRRILWLFPIIPNFNYCNVRILYQWLWHDSECFNHTVRPARSRRTPSTHPNDATPATCYTNAVRPKEQANDAYHTLTQYKATCDHNKLYVADFVS